MKTIFPFRAIIPMLSALALTSCFSPAEDNADAIDSSTATTRLKVTTRAATGQASYPILVIAYDDSGTLKGQQTIQSEDDEISLKLGRLSHHGPLGTKQLHRTFELRPEVRSHQYSCSRICPVPLDDGWR